ncbi:MAG: circadian clock protein KaiB [Leptolyngbyaceae cyanobacterium RU_5_1]|nr:circadian clock protein KaiB [Leptolyngbyaceae cyanobacterium RU_5_1]
MSSTSPLKVFKGIALFTPGGDLVYCVDFHKQIRWHVHLCGMLQHLLGLPEPPHFLVPCYSATFDRSLNSQTQQLQDVAEASPLVLRYQPLLNAVFETDGAIWQATPLAPEICDPVVLATYRAQFPTLWQNHNLIVRYEQTVPYTYSIQPSQLADEQAAPISSPPVSNAQGYVLRLFVSGHSMATERTLQTLHQLLEEVLNQPYTLKVIDVSQHPDQAELNQVSATPTLVRVYPRPIRRIVGDLNNADQLLGVLSLPDT